MTGQGLLTGETAIMTGSSSPTGIGAAIAGALAEQGAYVVVHCIISAIPAQEVVRKVKSYGVEAIPVRSDASSADFGNVLVPATLETFNSRTIDIIVNNSGVSFDSGDEIYHVNIRAPFLLTQTALPYMTSGGRIINVGSIAARMDHSMLTVYGSSKSVLTSMSVSMAQELDSKGSRINVVASGSIQTAMSRKDSPMFEKLEADAHIQKEGKPEQIASAVAWLAGPGASYVTSQLHSC